MQIWKQSRDYSRQSWGWEAEHTLWFAFKASNNQTEYEAIIISLRQVKNLGACQVSLLSDSRLVINQIGREFEKNEELIKYLEMTKQLITTFEVIHVDKFPRENNNWAYVLSKLTSSATLELGNIIYVNLLQTPSINKEILCVYVITGWMTPIPISQARCTSWW